MNDSLPQIGARMAQIGPADESQAASANTHYFLSLAQHAADLNVPEGSIRNRISRNQWPVATVRIGGRRLVPRGEHERLLAILMSGMSIPLSGPGTLAECERLLTTVRSGNSVSAPIAPDTIAPRRRGRPRKAAPVTLGDVA